MMESSTAILIGTRYPMPSIKLWHIPERHAIRNGDTIQFRRRRPAQQRASSWSAGDSFHLSVHVHRLRQS